jgi:hypothetical protein
MIDSNTAIAGTFKVAKDTFTLAEGWEKKCYTGNQPWKDSLEAINRTGFEQEDGMKGFGVMNRQNSSKDEVLSNGVDDSHSKVKGRRNLPKG